MLYSSLPKEDDFFDRCCVLSSSFELQNNNIKEQETEHVARVNMILLNIFFLLPIATHLFSMMFSLRIKIMKKANT